MAAKRRKKYGWLYHGEHDAWMPPDGAYLAEKEGRLWQVWRLESPYKTSSIWLIAEGGSTLEDVVVAADQDRCRRVTCCRSRL